jgi:hypothetical protein
MKKLSIKKGTKVIFISAFIILLIGLILVFIKPISMFLNVYPTSIFRTLLEILYFLSSFFLLIVAFIGLKQLKISKDTSKISSKRESFKIAVERCTYYLESIIPRLDDIDNMMKERNIESFGETIIEIEGKIVKFTNKPNDQDKDKISEIEPKIVSVLNSIEAFCVFFTSGVADENVAYNSIGNTFCHTVKKLLPEFCMLLDYGYKNIFKLYLLWIYKSEKQEALKAKKMAEKKLKNECTIQIETIGV